MDGVIAGVGNVVVFVPQIALLFLFIGLLEDLGYLARAAFVIDRVMRAVGLHGRAFVPMLSGFSCAIPAVMATRTLESRTDRLLTMMVLPLTSCSARLPVYVLVTATVFAPGTRVRVAQCRRGGALCHVFAVGRLRARRRGRPAAHRAEGPVPTLVLELPPYRMPSLVGVAARRLAARQDVPGRRRNRHPRLTIVSLGAAVVPEGSGRSPPQLKPAERP